MKNKKLVGMRLWLIDPEPPQWVLEALQSLSVDKCNKTELEIVSTPEEWEKKAQKRLWPGLIVTEYNLPWLETRRLLQLISLQPAATFVALLSDKPSDEEITALFDEGLDLYMRKSPPRPNLLRARLERLLHKIPVLMQERLNLGKQVKEITARAESVEEIAAEVFPLLSSFLRACWGVAILREEERARFVGHHGAEVEISPEDLLSVTSATSEETLHFSVQDLPPEAAKKFLDKGLAVFNAYRLFGREDAEEWFMFGWKRFTRVARERRQLTSELLQWIGAASQRAFAESVERSRRRLTEALVSLMLRLNRSLSPDKVAEEVLKGIKALVPYDRASVWLWTPTRKLRLAAHDGFNVPTEQIEDAVHSTKPPIEEWATVQILTNGHRPMFLENVRDFPEWQDFVGEQGVLSWIGMPILYDEQVLGMVFLDKFSPGRFSMKDIETLQGLMTAAGIAFYNAKLFREQSKWRERSLALRGIALQMVSTLDPQEVLQQLVSETLLLTRAEDVHIFFYNGDKLEFVAGEHRKRRMQRPYWYPRENGLTYTVARNKQPIIVPDAREHPLYADSPWSGAIVGMPLVVRGNLLGVLNVAWSKPREFSSDDIDLLGNFADYAAIALENARLVASLEKRVSDLTELARLGEEVRSRQPSDELAAMVVKNAVSLADADFGMIANFTGDALRIRGVFGLPQELVGRKIPTDYGICWSVLSGRGITTFYNLVPEDLLPPGTGGIPAVNTALAFPIKSESENETATMGCLLVGWRTSKPSLSPEVFNTLQLLAMMVVNMLVRARSQAELEEAFLQAVTALSRALDERDHYHGDHSERLSRWSAAVARELGCSDEEIEVIKQAALLHDIGKIGIPDSILRKPGPLTEEEWEIIKQHPLIGARILRPLERLRPVAEIVEAHHERWDGSGYPHGLKGDEIPLGARIIAVVDSYGAMIDERIYRSSVGFEEALWEIKRGSGTLYDPRVVEAFLRVAESFREENSSSMVPRD